VSGRRRAIGLELLAVVGACLGLALWQTGACQGRWSTHYLGGGELEGWLWRFWWMKKLMVGAWTGPGATLDFAAWVALVAGAYPETGNVVDLQVLSWPLEALLGAPLYYNVKCALILALNAVSGYVLGRGLFRDRAGAAVAALVMGLCPYALNEIANGRVRQAILFPLALYALNLVRLWRRPTPAQAVWTGVWAGITSAVYLYYGMAAGLFTFLFVAWAAVGGMAGRLTARRLGLGGLALVVALLTSLPFAWAYVDHHFSGHGLFELSWRRDFPTLGQLTSPDTEALLKQNDQLLSSLQRFRNDSLPWEYPFMPRFPRGLPWIFSILALTAVHLAWLQGRGFRARVPEGLKATDLVPWLLGALFFYLLTLGPYLRTGAEGDYVAFAHGGVATPYVWFFKYLPAFSRLFSPIRMSGMLVVCVAVLAGASLSHLLARWSPPSVLRVASVLLVALLVAHGLGISRALPLPETRILVPEYYDRLAREPFCAVVELPFRTGDYIQYYQTIHQKRLLGGWSGVTTPPGFPEGEVTRLAQVYLRLSENTFLKYLEGLNSNPERPGAYSERDLDFAIQRVGVRRVIVHERGYYRDSPFRGREQYELVVQDLQKNFGPPLEICSEMAFERLGPNQDPGDPGPYSYEMAVFQIAGEPASGRE